MVLLYHVTSQEWVGRLAMSIWYMAQSYVLLFSAYVFAPAVLYLIRASAINRLFRSKPAEPAQTSFVLLVPAHNEEMLLPKLLASIKQLNYPPAFIRTVVVADNCTDRTAKLAQRAGAECLVRTTPYPSSKSQALLYAAETLGIGPSWVAPVVCVLDADCQLDAQFLTELDRHFAQPQAAPVVQCARSVGNAFDSDVTVLDAAAEALRQRVGGGTRYWLGLESFIFGLGCCMRGAVFARLMALPVSSLAEDKEWKAYLAQQRVPVAYCPAAHLSYQAVDNGPAFQKQRRRWLSGHLASVKAHGLPMLAQGLWRGRISQVDFACDLLQPPRSCLLLAALVFGLVAATPSGWSLVSGWAWLGLAIGLLGYGALGLFLIGANLRHLLVLLSGWRLVLGVVKSLGLIVVGYQEKEWAATRPPTRKLQSPKFPLPELTSVLDPHDSPAG